MHGDSHQGKVAFKTTSENRVFFTGLFFLIWSFYWWLWACVCLLVIEAYLGPCQIFMTEFFWDNSQQLKTVNCFRKIFNTPLIRLNTILNTPLYPAAKHMFKFINKNSILISLISLIFKANPFLANAPTLYPPKNTRKPKVFWYFQGVWKRNIGQKKLIIKSIMIVGFSLTFWKILWCYCYYYCCVHRKWNIT